MDKDDLVLYTKAMGMKGEDAVKYCKDRGYTCTLSTYRKRAKRVETDTLARLHTIAKNLRLHHVQRLDQLHAIQAELWENYHLAEEMPHKISILRELREIQVYISSYYAATQSVMETAVKDGKSLPVLNR